MQYTPGTTQYNGDGIELLQDLHRAGFRYDRLALRNNTPTIIATSCNRQNSIGIQRENGCFVLVSVDDSLNVFTERVAQRRKTETEFKKSVLNPVLGWDLEQLMHVNQSHNLFQS